MTTPDRRTRYSRRHADTAGITPADIGADGWEDADAVKRWQSAAGLSADGWFGPKSARAFRRTKTGARADRIKVFDEWVTVPGVDSLEYRPGVLSSRARRPSRVVNSIVLHQSCTASRKRTERVLTAKGLGVCSLIDGDGTLTVYGDIGLRQTAHGNERNGCSVGVEIVNPYYPRHDGAAYIAHPLPWVQVVTSTTAHKGREVVDTEAQLKTACAWVRFLGGLSVNGPGDRSIDIPKTFPTTRTDSPSRGHKAWFDLSVGGVFAHGHRPGHYPAGHSKAGRRSGSHADARRTAWLLKGQLGWT